MHTMYTSSISFVLCPVTVVRAEKPDRSTRPVRRFPLGRRQSIGTYDMMHTVRLSTPWLINGIRAALQYPDSINGMVGGKLAGNFQEFQSLLVWGGNRCPWFGKIIKHFDTKTGTWYIYLYTKRSENPRQCFWP